MKLLLKLSVAILAFLPSTQVIAADIDTLPPPPEVRYPAPPVLQLRPATYDWTGIYVGAFGAATCINGTLVDQNPPAKNWLNAGCGFKGGGLVGYNRQFGPIVVGAELDAAAGTAMVNNFDLGANFSTGVNYVGTARVRGGWAVDDTLFYLTAGGTYAQAFVNSFSGGGNLMTANPYGYVIGGGVEDAVTDHMRLRVEYLYTHMFDSHYTCPTCNIDVHWGDQHEARIAAIWAF